MKIYGLTVLSTLALSACLPSAAAENKEVAANASALVGGGVIANNSANAGDANQNDGQNNDGSLDQDLNGDLGSGFEDINIDPNDIQGSLGQNILDLMLALGICNFNLNSLQGLGLGNEIQLLLQLQQLQQLQALGIVNSFSVDQLIQQEILSQTFNLGIIKRSIDASVKLSTRGKKRPAILKRQCVNTEQPQGNANAGAIQVGQDQAGQADQDQANEDLANQDQANGEQAEGEEVDAEEQVDAEAEQDNPEGVEVSIE